MNSTTTVRSWPAIGLGVFFASVTGYVLFSDVIGGAAINTSHVLSLAALVAAIASGHMVWPAATAGRIVTALMLMVLFLAATGYVVVSSGARNAETAGAKASKATAHNTELADKTTDLARARQRLADAEKMVDIETKNGGCPDKRRDGRRSSCSDWRQRADEVRSHVTALENEVKKIGPATPASGYAHASRVLAAIAGGDADVIEARLVLILPFLTVLIAELGTITFLHLGMGHRTAPTVLPVVTAADVAEWVPQPPKGGRREKPGPKRNEAVVEFVAEFRKRHGRNPSTPELQARFASIPRSTAHRYASAA